MQRAKTVQKKKDRPEDDKGRAVNVVGKDKYAHLGLVQGVLRIFVMRQGRVPERSAVENSEHARSHEYSMRPLSVYECGIIVSAGREPFQELGALGECRTGSCAAAS